MYTWHLTYSSGGRQAFFPTAGGALAGVHALLPSAGDRLAAFCVVDDHVHAAPVASAADLPHLRRSLLRSLRAVTPVPVTPPDVRKVDSRSYLTWLVRYLLLQPRKHGLPGHPALWPGSFFLDLAGARNLPGLDLQLLRVLPRFRLRTAFQVLELGEEPLESLSDEQVAWLPLRAVVRAAAHATGAPPDPTGRTLPEQRARRAAAHLLSDVGLTRSQIGQALERPRQTVHDILSFPPDPRDLAALRRRLALEDRIATLAARQSA